MARPAPEANVPEFRTAEGFSALYEAYLPPVLRYLRARLGEHAGEDAATEVFVVAFRQRHSYRADHSSPLPWLYAIASNVIANHRRAERRRLRSLERLTALAPRIGAGDPERTGLSIELVRSIRRLGHKDREVLLLVAWGELSYDEVAQALSIPVGTVRSRLARVRKALASELGSSPNVVPPVEPWSRHA